MVAPAQIEPVAPGRGVKPEGEGKELKKDPERNTGAPLEQAADRKRDEKSRDENRDRRDRSLSISQGQHSLGGKVAERGACGQAISQGDCRAHAQEKGSLNAAAKPGGRTSRRENKGHPAA